MAVVCQSVGLCHTGYFLRLVVLYFVSHRTCIVQYLYHASRYIPSSHMLGRNQRVCFPASVASATPPESDQAISQPFPPRLSLPSVEGRCASPRQPDLTDKQPAGSNAGFLDRGPVNPRLDSTFLSCSSFVLHFVVPLRPCPIPPSPSAHIQPWTRRYLIS